MGLQAGGHHTVHPAMVAPATDAPATVALAMAATTVQPLHRSCPAPHPPLTLTVVAAARVRIVAALVGSSLPTTCSCFSLRAVCLCADVPAVTLCRTASSASPGGASRPHTTGGLGMAGALSTTEGRKSMLERQKALAMQRRNRLSGGIVATSRAIDGPEAPRRCVLKGRRCQ